jgi:hypothetical protein
VSPSTDRRFESDTGCAAIDQGGTTLSVESSTSASGLLAPLA